MFANRVSDKGFVFRIYDTSQGEDQQLNKNIGKIIKKKNKKNY